jgi:uncharacterized protein (TIGR01615 family)
MFVDSDEDLELKNNNEQQAVIEFLDVATFETPQYSSINEALDYYSPKCKSFQLIDIKACMFSLPKLFILIDDNLYIDFDFHSQFDIAKSSEEYKNLINKLPKIFIGSKFILCTILRLMCRAMCIELENQGMEMAPWRYYENILKSYNIEFKNKRCYDI